jgi:long-chain fatty acid transport protein
MTMPVLNNSRAADQIKAALLGLGLAALFAARAFGGGIEVPMQNARASGQADAFIAQADDASAVWYNPAGLTQVHGTQFIGGLLALFPDWNFNADNGPGDEMTQEGLLPHFYLASDLGTERFRVGIGINNSFGLREDWGPDSPVRYIIDEAQLIAMNISPAVAYQVDDHLSLGFALNIYYGDLSLNRSVQLGAPPIPDGSFHLEGHDWAVGFTPSVMWKINDQHQIGAFYRSEVAMNLHGSAELGVPGGPDVPPQHSTVTLNLPQQIGIGYSFKPIEDLKLEADLIWTDWSQLNDFRIKSDSPLFNKQEIPTDWQSGFTYRLGAQYRINDTWTIRGGYAYSQNAVPNATFTPIVPDSDYHLFAVGIGYTKGNLSLDLAYNFIYREDREIHNSALSPTVDGTWTNSYHCVMLSATYTF